ncbi:hypothetical protein LCGC14_0392020 [marine sediment metagenome]|uniref:Uncharacterized protein n=1 Tax=marine sediment metagenome TaxID=412755 RepID=A0A0F9W894_9ZZZZ
MMLFPADQIKMVNELLADVSGALTYWEIDFIEKCARQFDVNQPLVGMQTEKLKEIWQKVFG